MQLFKAFCMIGKRRITTISIYFIIYAAITIILSVTSKDSLSANFRTKELSVCVQDEDNSEVSRALTAYLGSIHNLVEMENNPEVLQEHLYYRDIDYVLTIKEGFQDKVLKGESDSLVTNVKVPGSSAGYFADQQVTQYIQLVQLYLNGGFSMDEALVKTIDSLENTENVKNITFDDNNQNGKKEVFYFYQYLPYVFILLLFCGLAPIIIIFQEKDMRNRINCSCQKLLERNLQLALGGGVYSICIWLLFIILGTVVYGGAMFSENALYAMLNSFVFLLISVALTLLFSCFNLGANVMNVVNSVSNILGLGMSFLGGVFVPQNMLSDKVLAFARFLPTYWYIRANNMLAGFSTEVFDMHLYWNAIGIQLLFALAAFTLTLAAAKLRRQEA